MLTLLGREKRACDGVTRRDLLRAGTLGLFSGMSLPRLLQAEATNHPQQPAASERLRAATAAGWVRPGKAKHVILLNLFGGPPTQDLFDMKPDAPVEVRGEFKPISTSAPGIQICERLPQMAKWMHRTAIIRSLSREGNDHTPLPMLTGYTGPPLPGSKQGLIATRFDPPSMGSVCSYLGLGNQQCPPYVHMPCYIGWGQDWVRAGQYGGFLGKQYDPLTTRCSPSVEKPARYDLPQLVRGTPELPGLEPGITIDRLRTRRSLLEQLDFGLRHAERDPALTAHNDQVSQAFHLLTSSECRQAFDLSKVGDRERDRYGRTLFGESVLIGRRLIEAGARFVTATYDVFWISPGLIAAGARDIDEQSWDLHWAAFPMMKGVLLPVLDQVYGALMEDLEKSGLIDDTLVVVMGEMGRASKVNSEGGRGHWTACYSCLMSGAGIQGGAVWGASDKRAEFPALHPVSPGDVCATIYECLGIDSHMPVPDAQGRPIPIAHGGRAIRGILA